MLSAKNRLNKARDIQKTKESGNSFFSALFRVRVRQNEFDYSRFAVVVSNKVSKKATERNQLKRRIREILRLNLAKFKPGYDVLLSANNKALVKTYQELEVEVLKVLNKAKLLS